MSIRKYMTVPELLADWRYNTRKTAINAQHANALGQRAEWSWRFLMRRWGYPETRDIDEIAQIIRER